ncbi:hypothetical protein BDV40DRAFT_262355 [Aspergillus tamarii]|uniref:Uncharacterized protein n=1 Tax=Aspergillus tamarii TaxID=41984 RepID=A0A5N6V0W2_ASPTM|nr:hypothetical protein BDV40DRAFT_262355 [Aspergillus tamarii]
MPSPGRRKKKGAVKKPRENFHLQWIPAFTDGSDGPVRIHMAHLNQPISTCNRQANFWSFSRTRINRAESGMRLHQHRSFPNMNNNKNKIITSEASQGKSKIFGGGV